MYNIKKFLKSFIGLLFCFLIIVFITTSCSNYNGQAEKLEVIEAEKVINSFFKAQKDLDFYTQKELSDSYVRDYVTRQEFKYYYRISKSKRTVKTNSAEINYLDRRTGIGTIEFIETFEKENGYIFKILIGNKIYLEKKENMWKIVDYDINGIMVSDLLYMIEEDYESQRNIGITINEFYFFKK